MVTTTDSAMPTDATATRSSGFNHTFLDCHAKLCANALNPRCSLMTDVGCGTVPKTKMGTALFGTVNLKGRIVFLGACTMVPSQANLRSFTIAIMRSV